MDRSQKAVIIEGMKAKAVSASIAVMTEFKGMTVEESTDLRVALRNAGGEYHVIKNTLGRIAFSDTKHDAVKNEFHDNTGVALGFEDPVQAAKAISTFAKDSKTLIIRGGSLDGKVLSVEDVEALSKLPGREQLLAQLLATMNAVPTNFVSLLANTVRGLLYALKAIEEQKGKQA